MKVIIAGGRDYFFLEEDMQKLDLLKDSIPITDVVSGGAPGADTHGARWALRNHIPVKISPANWSDFGKKAGPIRNKQMAEYADAYIMFPGGRGTDDMFRRATDLGLVIYDFRGKQ